MNENENTLHEWYHLKNKSRHAGFLLKKFETKSVFQDESDFPLQVPINSQNDHVCFKDQKKDVTDKNLSHQTDGQSVKVMVSAALTWFGVTKPLFVNEKGLKDRNHITMLHKKRSVASKLTRKQSFWLLLLE